MNNRNIWIDVPSPVQQILNRLKSHGYEAYIVGGCVRDALLGRVPGDWDITTSALPLEVKSLFHNTVDTGLKHGTVMVLLEGEGYEVTTYRVDGEYKDGRHPESVTFTRSLEEDLKRRDFTINAFAWDEEGVVDLFDGLSDLETGVIRCVGNPAERFREDALRIMRAVRFSAQLGFSIEEETRKQAANYAPRLSDISMERIRVEWEKTLLSDHPCLVNTYRELGMAPYILGKDWEKCFDSQLDPLLLEILNQKEYLCDWEKNPVFSLSFSEEDGRELFRRLQLTAFFLYLNPEEASAAFRKLKYDNRTKDAVVKILKYKDTVFSEDPIRIRQLLNQMGAETYASVLELQKAALGCKKEQLTEAEVSRPDYERKDLAKLEQVTDVTADVLKSGTPWKLSMLAVNGSDLIAAGVPAGKKLGDVLEKILQKVMVSPTLNTKEYLCSKEFISEVVK